MEFNQYLISMNGFEKKEEPSCNKNAEDEGEEDDRDFIDSICSIIGKITGLDTIG